MGHGRVLVLGGGGFLGRRTVAALRRVEGLDVATAGRRRGELRLDLSDPGTFGALEGHDVVVNCADTVAAPPDAAARHVLARGGRFVESTADTATNARLLGAELAGPGTLVLGAGLFPGLSNLLAASTAGRLGPHGCTSLQVAVRYTPLSGCGPGTVSMMVDALSRDAVHVVDGRPAPGPPIAAGPALPFRAGRRRTLRVGLTEPMLLHRSTRVANIGTFIAPIPALAWPFAVMSGWLPRWMVAAAPSRWLTRVGLRVLRSIILGWRAADVELLAVARGPAGEVVRRAHVGDGFDATAHAIAALVERVVELPPAPGLLLPDQVLTVEEAVERMSRQGCAVTLDA